MISPLETRTNFERPTMTQMHEIDYEIHGDAMQFVEIELDPMEAAVAEAGGMMYMEDGVEMETIFGDGSQQQSGFLGALMGAGKRLLTGESLFMTVFLNRSRQKRKVAFGVRRERSPLSCPFCARRRLRARAVGRSPSARTSPPHGHPDAEPR